MQLAVVIFPDASGGPAVERFRARWDPLADWIPGHITLVFPFEWPASLCELSAILARVAAEHAPFEVDLGDAALWEDEYVFLLARVGDAAVRALHSALCAAIPGATVAGAFTPHMTVGRRPSASELAAALAEAHSLSLRGTARALSVYRIDPGARRRELDIPLGP